MTLRMIVFAIVVSFMSTVMAQTIELPDSSAVTGISTTFNVTNSEYLNITVESSNSVFAFVQSIPRQITINVAKPEVEIISTTLTIRNLAPHTNYYMLKNGTAEVIITNEDGVYVCDVDLSMPQKIIIAENQ